jgi:hypothetical protein
MKKLVLIGSLLLAGNTFASTITIDFEQPKTWSNPIPDAEGIDNPYSTLVTQGFEFNTQLGFEGYTEHAYCPWCTTSMEKVSGETFDLLSFDLGSYLTSGAVDQITITGFYAGGGQASKAFNFAPNAGMTSFTLAAADAALFSNLESIEFGTSMLGGAGIIDNITVSAVPIPAAVWLFGSALAGLGWFRRKQTV